MEQPCYKCGQTVEEGTPFCPHCSAPQIRVVVAEPLSSPASSTSIPSTDVATLTAPSIAVPVSWSGSVRPCVLAALISAITIVLKLVVPLIAIIGAGFLAVAFYRRGAPDTGIDGKAGARLGAICGFFSFGFVTVIGSLKVIVLHQGGEIRQTMLDAIQQAAARYPDPQFQPTLDFMRSPAGLVFMMVFFLIFAFLAFLALGTLGGVLGGLAFRRRDRN